MSEYMLEKFEQILDDVEDSAGRMRRFYDILHVMERFVIRGLEQLRPRTYEAVKTHYGLAGSIDDIEDDFIDVFPQFQADFSEQYLNFSNLAMHIIRKGIRVILDELQDKEDSYVVISKKFNMAVAFVWRQDRSLGGIRNAYGQTAFNIRTMRTLKPGDHKIFVENGLVYECPDSPYLQVYRENNRIYRSFKLIEV